MFIFLDLGNSNTTTFFFLINKDMGFVYYFEYFRSLLSQTKLAFIFESEEYIFLLHVYQHFLFFFKAQVIKFCNLIYLQGTTSGVATGESIEEERNEELQIHKGSCGWSSISKKG